MDKNDIKPSEDGITHINIYSKGKTELGRLLSNFAHTPFIHPDYGPFLSLEGFWYWIGTGKIHEELRNVHSYTAKQCGQSYKRIPIDDFEKEILLATRCKIEQNLPLRNLLLLNKLPLVHYYRYGTDVNYRLIFTDKAKFQLDYLEQYSFMNELPY